MTYLTSVAGGVADGGSTTHDSPSLTVSGSNKVMWVLAMCSDGTPGAPSGVVWDPAGLAQALSPVGSSITFATFGNAQLFRLVAPGDATGVVRITWAATKGERSAIVWVETGVDQGTPNGTVVTGTGTANGVASGAVSTSPGQRVLHFAHAISTGVFSAAPNFNTPSGTERHDDVTAGTAYDAFAAQEQVAAGASTSPSWAARDDAGDGWVSFAFAVNDTGGPTVSAQPDGSAAAVGATTSYAVTSPDATSYQWQVSTNRGESWSDVSDGSGGTTATYTTAAATSAHNGRKYRCVLTNAGGNTTSIEAFFHVSGLTRNGRATQTPGLPDAQAWERIGRRPPSLAPGTWYAFRYISGGQTRDFAAAARARFFPDAPPLAPPAQAIWSNRLKAELPRGYGAPLRVQRQRGMPVALLSATDAAVPVSDSATGSEAVSIAAALTGSDTSVGSDIAAVGVSVAPTDTSSGSETAALLASQGLSDSASGSDALTAIAVALDAADSGAGSDSVAIGVAINLADSGTGSDGVTVDTGGTPVAISDSATGSDAASLTAGIDGPDSGAGTDSATFSATLDGADSGTGADTAVPDVALSPTDTSSGSEAAELLAGQGLSDAGSGSDSEAQDVAITASDSGTGSDQILVDTGSPDKDLFLADSGVGSDGISVEQTGESLGGGRAASRFLELADYTHTIKMPRLADSALGEDWITVERYVGAGVSLQREFDFVLLPPKVSALKVFDAGYGFDSISVDRRLNDGFMPLIRSHERMPLIRTATPMNELEARLRHVEAQLEALRATR